MKLCAIVRVANLAAAGRYPTSRGTAPQAAPRGLVSPRIQAPFRPIPRFWSASNAEAVSSSPTESAVPSPGPALHAQWSGGSRRGRWGPGDAEGRTGWFPSAAPSPLVSYPAGSWPPEAAPPGHASWRPPRLFPRALHPPTNRQSGSHGEDYSYLSVPRLVHILKPRRATTRGTARPASGPRATARYRHAGRAIPPPSPHAHAR